MTQHVRYWQVTPGRSLIVVMVSFGLHVQVFDLRCSFIRSYFFVAGWLGQKNMWQAGLGAVEQRHCGIPLGR